MLMTVSTGVLSVIVTGARSRIFPYLRMVLGGADGSTGIMEEGAWLENSTKELAGISSVERFLKKKRKKEMTKILGNMSTVLMSAASLTWRL